MSRKITKITEPKEKNPGKSALAKHNLSAEEVNDIRETIDENAEELNGAIRTAPGSMYPYKFVWTGTQAAYDALPSHPTTTRFDILDA